MLTFPRMSEDRPIGGGGGYNINWDEIDENTNPFGLGPAFGGSKVASSPVRTTLPRPHEEDKEPALPDLSSPPSANMHQSGAGDQKEVGSKPESPKPKKNMKGPPPPPPARTVSNPGSPEHSGMLILRNNLTVISTSVLYSTICVFKHVLPY